MSATLQSIVLLFGLSAGALAQDPLEKPTQDKPAAKPAPTATTPKPAQTVPGPMVSANALRGTELTLEGAAPATETPPTGREPAAPVKARVEDVIFSTNDGRLSYAIVTVPGSAEGREKVVLVPAASLKLTGTEDRPAGSIRMTAAQVQSQAPFDLERARKEGVDVVLGDVKGTPPAPGAGEPKEKADKGGLEDPAKTPGADGAPRFALATQLATWSLDGNDKPFGRVKDAAIDTGRNTVAYFIVAPAGGGGTILVPFNACTCTRGEKDLLLKVAKTSEQLSTAPKYEKPAKGFLTTDQMQRAEEFFGTRGPVGSQG